MLTYVKIDREKLYKQKTIEKVREVYIHAYM